MHDRVRFADVLLVRRGLDRFLDLSAYSRGLVKRSLNLGRPGGNELRSGDYAHLQLKGSATHFFSCLPLPLKLKINTVTETPGNASVLVCDS